MFKLLFTLTATLALTGCPLDLERTNPDFIGSAFLAPSGDGIPRVEPETPGIDPEEPETPEVPPETCEGPECDPEVPPEELVPVAHPACVVDERRIADVTAPELSYERAEDGTIPFRAYFVVNDESLCDQFSFGDIDRIEIPEQSPIYDGGERVREPDGLYRFDPETGEGAWMGDGGSDLPAAHWHIVIPLNGPDGSMLVEMRIYIEI